MKDYVFLFLILLLAVGPPVFSKITESLRIKRKDGFTLGGTDGIYPCSQTDVLVQDTYPITGVNGVSDQSADKMWTKYPIFELGSFKQMTKGLQLNWSTPQWQTPLCNTLFATPSMRISVKQDCTWREA